MANENATADDQVSRSILVVDATTGETRRLESQEVGGKSSLIVTANWSPGEWTTTRVNYTGAQTNTAVLTASSSQQIVVKKVSVLADNANSVDVAARVGFGASTTPTGDGTILSHPGIASGSGVIEYLGEAGVIGALNDDLRITNEVPTGGSIDVIVVYKII